MIRLYCIDIGNTRTHCALIETDGASVSVADSADFPSGTFAEIFDSQKLFQKSGADAIAWCSVVPSHSRRLASVLPDGVDSMQLTHLNSPLVIDVKIPSQLGQDRIADAVGAGMFFKPPYIVVDMGTAVTIDLVDANGHYAGGAIAPGMYAFAEYLGEKAAQLPKIDPADADYEISIGRDTVEAMHVGCVKGFCRLADGLISDIERDWFGGESARDKTVFTGGSVAQLPKKWLANRKIESNLAHIGLARSYLINRGHLKI